MCAPLLPADPELNAEEFAVVPLAAPVLNAALLAVEPLLPPVVLPFVVTEWLWLPAESEPGSLPSALPLYSYFAPHDLEWTSDSYQIA